MRNLRIRMPRGHPMQQQQVVQSEPLASAMSTPPPLETRRRRSISSKIGKFAKRLRLSQRDSIVTTMPAFRVSDLPARGTIVITRRHICFCPALPSLAPEVKLKFSDVVSICKERVFSLFPTGIRITTAQRAVTFSNLGSRDRLLQQLQSAWGAASDRRASDTIEIVNQVEVLTDDSNDSGFEASPVVHQPEQQQQQQQQQQLDDSPMEENNRSPDIQPILQTNYDDDLPSPALMPSCGGMDWVSRFRITTSSGWAYASEALVLAMLILCSIFAIYLSIRVLSLQRQVMEITGAQANSDSLSSGLKTYSSTLESSPLTNALHDISTLSRHLASTSKSLINADNKQ